VAVAVLSAAQAAAASAGLALALAKVKAAMGTGAEALPLALAHISKTQQRHWRKKRVKKNSLRKMAAILTQALQRLVAWLRRPERYLPGFETEAKAIGLEVCGTRPLPAIDLPEATQFRPCLLSKSGLTYLD
jgi:hypothetical protein